MFHSFLHQILTVFYACIFWIPVSSYESSRNSSEISKLLTEYRVIPDLLRIAPLHTIKATYTFGFSPDFGNLIEVQYIKHYPYILIWPFEAKNFYTLLLVDLDAPSAQRPKKREWLHYLLANIPGPCPSHGDTLAPYVPPNPRLGSGQHRLVYLVFLHPRGRINFSEKTLANTNDAARAYFSTRKFSRKYKLGEPFAINFFLTEAAIPTTTPLYLNETYEAEMTSTFS